MKRVVVAAILLALIIAYSVSALFIIRYNNDKLITALDGIEESFSQDDTEEALRFTQTLEAEWEKYEKRMTLLVNDTKLQELDSGISKIKPYILMANDELEAEIRSIRSKLMLIYLTERPLWYNIL